MKKILTALVISAVCTSTWAGAASNAAPYTIPPAANSVCLVKVSSVHWVDANRISVIEIIELEPDRLKPRRTNIEISVGVGNYYNARTVLVSGGPNPEAAVASLTQKINNCK